MENKKVIGILSVVLGLLLIIFPLFGNYVLAIIAGVSLIVVGIYLLLVAIPTWKISKTLAIAYIILGILSLILGICLFGNVLLFSFLVGFELAIIGFIYIISGISGVLARKSTIGKGSSVLLIVIGILTVVLGQLALDNPIYVALLIGIGLIIEGIAFITAPKIE